MSTEAELEQYILKTHNSKKSENSMGVNPRNPTPLWVRQCN